MEDIYGTNGTVSKKILSESRQWKTPNEGTKVGEREREQGLSSRMCVCVCVCVRAHLRVRVHMHARCGMHKHVLHSACICNSNSE